MGYDFLGTMHREQWDKLTAFIKNVQNLALEKHKDTDDFSIYVKHLQADYIRANITYNQLVRAAEDFSGFMGDNDLTQDRIATEGTQMRTKFRLADSDVAYSVDQLKRPIRQILKRKKDNLEYRIKKYYDLIYQLIDKIVYFQDYLATTNIFIADVNTYFDDQFHKHSLSEEQQSNQYGLIEHFNTESRVITDSSATYATDQETSTYIDPRNME